MIRPTFAGFEIGKKGLTAAQLGLDITGHNLVNWDSEGYTRQRITQVAEAQNSYRNRYLASQTGTSGRGVMVTGIGQIRDVYLDKRFREETSDVGYYDQSALILDDIQSALNEYNPQVDVGLRTSLMAISDALQSFSINAYSETHANIVLSSFKNFAQTMQQISSKLEKAREQQVYDLEVSVQEVNTKLQKIAEVNRAILEYSAQITNNPYFGPNELYDERNLLLDELSQYADITYTSNADGTINVMIGDHTVVNSTKYDTIDLNENPKTGVVGLRWISTNTSVDLTAGSLKASVDYINGRGPNLRNEGESSVRGFLYYKDQMNELAKVMVNVINHIVPDTELDPATGTYVPKYEKDAAGNDIVDANGNKIPVYKKLMGAMEGPDENGDYFVNPDGDVTADNLSVTDEWAINSGYIIYMRNPDVNDTADSVANYALALADAIANETFAFSPNGEDFNGTFLDYIKNYVTTLAEDASYAETRLTATSVIQQNLEDSRDSVSGVVVDEEVANMMLYNKSLSAASRLMTAMDEALETLINKTGVVGR